MSDLPLHARIADERIAQLQAQLTEAKATISELLALIDAHNKPPCPQVFKVEVPGKYIALVDTKRAN